MAGETRSPLDADRVTVRPANEADLERLLEILADDIFSREREFFRLPLSSSQYEAFRAIDRNPDAALIVAEVDGLVVGVLQYNMTHLTFGGSRRATLEGVRVASSMRGSGIGTVMVEHAISLARRQGCNMVQLSTNRAREDAKRFYERLGFTASHVGMKLRL